LRKLRSGGGTGVWTMFVLVLASEESSLVVDMDSDDDVLEEEEDVAVDNPNDRLTEEANATEEGPRFIE